MTRYRYRAARADGRVVSGVLLAAAPAEVSDRLLGQGLQPLSLDQATGQRFWRPRASRRDLAAVFRGLATLATAGVPLDRALRALEALPRQPALRRLLEEARVALREGRGLADALRSDDELVPAVTLGMLRAGERGSTLGAALEQAALQLERDAELRSRVRQATAYPLVLVVTGACSVLVIVTVVLPKFAVLLSDLGQALPPATRLLLAISALVHHFGWLLLLGGVLGVSSVLSYIASPAGRMVLHQSLLRLPVIGRLRHSLATARIARALGGMLTAGVPMLAALEAARDAAGDDAISERLNRVRRRVAQGEPLTSSLAAERGITPTPLQLFQVGEASGQLGIMALRAGDLAAGEAESGIRTLVSLLEPTLVVVFGGMVAFVAAALLQAVYSLRPG